MWVFFPWHFCNRMSVWQCNWHTKDPESNTCRNWYFLAANVLLFIRRRAIEDYKPEAAVCVVFLTISHWAVSAVLLCILTLTLSRLHCIRIYHISYKVAQHEWKEMSRSSECGRFLMCLQMLVLIQAASYFCSAWMNPYQCFLSLVTLKGVSGWRCCDCEQVESYYSYRKVEIIPNLHFFSSFCLFISFYFTDIVGCMN